MTIDLIVAECLRWAEFPAPPGAFRSSGGNGACIVYNAQCIAG